MACHDTSPLCLLSFFEYPEKATLRLALSTSTTPYPYKYIVRIRILSTADGVVIIISVHARLTQVTNPLATCYSSRTQLLLVARLT